MHVPDPRGRTRAVPDALGGSGDGRGKGAGPHGRGRGARRNARGEGVGRDPGGPSASRGARSRSAAPARGARWLLLLLVAFGSVHLLFMLGVEGLRFMRAQVSIERLEREVAGLEAEARELQAIIDHADDESYREQLARRQGYMYPDETRIVTSEPR